MALDTAEKIAEQERQLAANTTWTEEKRKSVQANLELAKKRQGFAGQVTSDAGEAGDLETQSFQERSGLGGDKVTAVQPAFWDASRGITVHAPFGKMFELLEGGGVRTVDMQAKTEATEKSSLFSQPTQGGEPTPGFKEEKLGIEASPGKTIKRTGQTFFDEKRGVDVHASEGMMLVENEDGTIEERPLGNIGAPTEAKGKEEFGPTLEELGVKPEGGVGPDGQPLDVDPLTGQPTAQQQAQMEAAATGLHDPGLIKNLFGQTFGRAPNAQEQQFWQARTDKIGDALLGAMEFAKAEGRTTGDLPKTSDVGGTAAGLESSLVDVDSYMANKYGIDLSALQEQLQVAPVASAVDIYKQIVEGGGMDNINNQVNQLNDEMEELDNKFADETEEINDNPFFSEALRSKKIRNAQAKFDQKRGLLVNRLTLLDGFADDIREEARFLTTAAVNQANTDREFQQDQIDKIYERAEKEMAAQRELFKFERQEAFSREELAEKRFESDRRFELDVAKFGLSQQREARIGSGGGGGGGGSSEGNASTGDINLDDDFIGLALAGMTDTEISQINKLGKADARNQFILIGQAVLDAIQDQRQQSMTPAMAAQVIKNSSSNVAGGSSSVLTFDDIN